MCKMVSEQTRFPSFWYLLIIDQKKKKDIEKIIITKEKQKTFPWEIYSG